MTETSESPRPAIPGASWEAVRDHWGWFLALGILWIVLGTVAVILPWLATVAAALTFGALLGAGGIMQIVQAFRCKRWRGTALHAVMGLLYLAAGVILLFLPFQGILTLTLVLAGLFIAVGILRIIAALQDRSLRGWGWLLFSGILGIGVGLIIWLGWPGTAAWALGLLVGIELIFSGWALVMIALAARKGTPPAVS